MTDEASVKWRYCYIERYHAQACQCALACGYIRVIRIIYALYTRYTHYIRIIYAMTRTGGNCPCQFIVPLIAPVFFFVPLIFPLGFFWVCLSRAVATGLLSLFHSLLVIYLSRAGGDWCLFIFLCVFVGVFVS